MDGLFNLVGFLHRAAAVHPTEELSPRMESESFTHSRKHTICFRRSLPELPADHPALTEFETINHMLCADPLTANPVTEVK